MRDGGTLFLCEEKVNIFWKRKLLGEHWLAFEAMQQSLVFRMKVNSELGMQTRAEWFLN
jgi:hypothetical protein